MLKDSVKKRFVSTFTESEMNEQWDPRGHIFMMELFWRLQVPFFAIINVLGFDWSQTSEYSFREILPR